MSRRQPPEVGESAEQPLPPAVALAWGLRAPGRSGPRPAFSIEQIVGASVDLADEVGLGQFSMAKVAARLGAAPMSLYRYIDSKAELLILMLDAAFGPVPDAAPAPARWRKALAFWAHSVHTAYREHPWMLEVPVRELPRTPNALSWVDLGLQSLAATGLTVENQLGALLLLDGHARNAARLTADLRDADEHTDLGPSYSEVMTPLLDPARFPALRRVLDTGAIDSPATTTGESGFEFGLQRQLDGIGVLIEGAKRRTAD